MYAKYYTNLNPYLLQSFMIKRREQDLPGSKMGDRGSGMKRIHEQIRGQLSKNSLNVQQHSGVPIVEINSFYGSISWLSGLSCYLQWWLETQLLFWSSSCYWARARSRKKWPLNIRPCFPCGRSGWISWFLVQPNHLGHVGNKWRKNLSFLLFSSSLPLSLSVTRPFK